MRQLTLLLMTASLLVGGVPQKISYQGYITHADGSLVSDGSYDVKFRLFQANEGGDALWEESQSLTIGSGLISATLGNSIALNFSESMHFLEIEINGEVLTPRQELTTVFYAFHAESASTATKSDTATYATKSANADTALYAKASVIATNSISDLSDALIENNSLYLGKDPSPTTDDAKKNVAVGTIALASITTGDDNVAVGYNALTSNTTGSQNTAMGLGALGSNTTGLQNTATGLGALGSNTTGLTNVAFGTEAGDVITTGNKNIIVGYNADPSTASASNQIVIGANATGHGDNIAVIGNDSATAIHPHDDDEVDLGSSSYEYKDLYVDGVAYLDSVGFGTTAMALPTADGTSGQVLSTDGSGSLSWSSSGASSIQGLSDALIENSSLYLGNDPVSTTSTAEYNTALGTKALEVVTTGDNNVAIGYTALTVNTSGYDNIAIGSAALKNNTTGIENTAIGSAALENNTTGSTNIAIGIDVLKANTTGGGNIAIGYDALEANTTGSSNIAIGVPNLGENTTGGGNIAIGSEALFVNTTGSQNIAIGISAGDVISTGDKNVIIGASSDPSASSASNQIVIGYGATGTGDNYAVIGNSDITRLYAASDGAAVLYADGTINSSDRRIKRDIEDVSYGLNYIMSLRSVTYYKKHPRDYPQELKDKFYPDGKVREVSAEDYDKRQIGLIAQEVKAVNEKLGVENNIVSIDEDGFHRMDYQKLVVPLIKAVQELSAKVDRLESQIEANSAEVSASQ